MGKRVKIQIALLQCKRCGKRYNNPLAHVCVRTFKSAAKKTTAKKGGKK